FRVLVQVLEEVGFIEVEFVSNADKFCHAHIFVGEQIPEHKTDSAALSYEGHPSPDRWVNRDEGQAETICRIGRGEAVRTYKPDIVLPGGIQEKVGQFLSLLPEFGKSSRQNSHALDAEFSAFF